MGHGTKFTADLLRLLDHADGLKRLRLLDHTVALARPLRGYTPYSFWHEHIPFAMYVVDVLRPRMLVELGAHYGVSYCAFCQAVKELGLDTRCYAVDTWKGDAHMSAYSEDVFADLRKHHDPLYGSFSTLLRCTFDEALEQFADGAIDLLHIDGYHTYEAVQHDFETWLPKLSPSAVVLLHDTNVRKDDYGVYRYYEELQRRYRCFDFLHGSGLGVVAFGDVASPEVRILLDADATGVAAIRGLFAELGLRWELEYRVEDLRRETQRQKAVIAQYEQVKETLEASIPVYDATIAKFEGHFNDLNAAYRNLEAQLAERDQTIQTLTDRLSRGQKY